MCTPNSSADPNIPWDVYKKEKLKRRGEKKETIKNNKDAAELSVESSEPSSGPWIRLKAIIRCIMKAIGSSCKNFIYDEGLLPFWFELVLFSFPGGVKQVPRHCMS